MNKRKTLIHKLKSEVCKLRKMTKQCNPERVKFLEDDYEKLGKINLELDGIIIKLQGKLATKPKEKFFKRIWNAIKGE